MADGETCPWCSAPRVGASACPRCGANYAKADLIKTQGRAPAAAAAVIDEQDVALETPIPAPIDGADDSAVDDPDLEWKISVAAIPVALALGLLFHVLTPGMQRIFFGMPIHELGHAVSAWLCGFTAVPTLWKTLVFEGRGVVMPLFIAGGLIYLMVRAWRAQKVGYVAVLVGLLAVQFIGTVLIREETAEMLGVFGGDGMGMVLAALLMATFFFGNRTQLYKGSLRWGFLVIGAAAFSDMFATWWVAQWNQDVIPFGENEGSGLSDPLRLIEDYGWTRATLVRRYVLVGVASLVGLAAVYVWGVRRARGKSREAAGS
jgi:hypothetical protein